MVRRIPGLNVGGQGCGVAVLLAGTLFWGCHHDVGLGDGRPASDGVPDAAIEDSAPADQRRDQTIVDGMSAPHDGAACGADAPCSEKSLRGKTCSTFGFKSGGLLTCSQSCQISTSYCHGVGQVIGPIAPGNKIQKSVAVALGGQHLVVWNERDASDTEVIRGRVVALNGTPKGSAVTLSSSATHATRAAVAFSSSSFLVVWSTGKNGARQIDGALITLGTSLKVGSTFRISDPSKDATLPAVAATKSSFVVVWQQTPRAGAGAGSWTVAGQVVDSTGGRKGLLVFDQGVDVVQAGGRLAIAASASGKLLAAWSDRRGPATSNIYVARIDASGRILDKPGVIIDKLGGPQHWPAVGSAGDRFLVAYAKGAITLDADIWGAVIDPAASARPLATAPICKAGRVQTQPRVGTGQAGFIVTWTDDRDHAKTRHDVYARRVDLEGAPVGPTDGFAITTAPLDQWLPALSRGSSGTLVFWQGDIVSGQSRIFAALITP